MINLFDDLPARAADEIFTEVLARESVRIERIVSTGQSTPTDKPHCQAHDCQSASDRDPRSASNRDPFVLRFERLALASSELVGVAETGRARVVG